MTTQSLDPRTGQVFGQPFPDSDEAEVSVACSQAQAAQRLWGSLAADRRAEVLHVLADALDAEADRLVPLADSETALGSARLGGELARTTFQLRLLADATRSGAYTRPLVDDAVPGAPPSGHPQMRRVLIPIGPVAVYAASNFPFAFSVAGGDTASALAAGCTVVVKAHPGHPQTCEEVHAILLAALDSVGLPRGVIGMVRGFSAGATLIQDPAIRAGAFTGSQQGGRALFDLAASRPDPIPFYGELGSVNPVVVLPSAAERAGLASDYVDSLLLGVGQFCTNPSILFVPAGADLIAEIASELSTRSPGVLLHPGVLDLLQRTVAKVASASGVRVLAGELPGGGGDTDGTVTGRPLLLGVTGGNLLEDRTPLDVECFGPVGLLVEYNSTEELLAVLASMEGALTGCVHGEVTDPIAAEVIGALVERVGRVAWNAWPTGVSVNRTQHHGGPWPATTSPLHTSVGVTAIRRFLRPVALQSVPDELLPDAWSAPETTPTGVID